MSNNVPATTCMAAGGHVEACLLNPDIPCWTKRPVGNFWLSHVRKQAIIPRWTEGTLLWHRRAGTVMLNKWKWVESCPVSLTRTLLAFPRMTINIYKQCKIAGNGDDGCMGVGVGGSTPRTWQGPVLVWWWRNNWWKSRIASGEWSSRWRKIMGGVRVHHFTVNIFVFWDGTSMWSAVGWRWGTGPKVNWMNVSERCWAEGALLLGPLAFVQHLTVWQHPPKVWIIYQFLKGCSTVQLSWASEAWALASDIQELCISHLSRCFRHH